MRKIHLILFVFIVSLISCDLSSQLSGVWMNQEKFQQKQYNKIYIIAQTSELPARQSIEDALANFAIKKGFQVVKSIEVMPPSINDTSLPTREAIVNSVKASGCDAAFVITLLKKEESVRYIPGVTVYSPMPYYSWNGRFVRYYDHWRPTVAGPGYFTKDRTYFLESNLYDVATEELMLSVQSDLFNPPSLNSFTQSFVKDLVRKMQRAGIIKK